MGSDVDAAPSVNVGHFAEIKHMVSELVSQCSPLKNLHEAAPLSLAHGARETPYSDADFGVAMQTVGEYKCGCNMLWLDFGEQGSPGRNVPLSMKQVTGLTEHYFKTPRSFPKDILVDADLENPPSRQKGKLVRISPPEIVHALVFAVYRDFKAGCDDSVTHAWRATMLSAPMTFKNMASDDDKHWRLLQEGKDILDKTLFINLKNNKKCEAYEEKFILSNFFAFKEQ